MHLILTGATGLIGSGILTHILSLPASKTAITHLTVLTRSPIPATLLASIPKHPHIELSTIIHQDFSTYPPSLLTQLRGSHACIWSLGVSQNDVSKDLYIRVTKDYAIAAAKAFSTIENDSGKFVFVYVSGEGATLIPGPFTTLYGKVKGETERALLELSETNEGSRLRVYSPRPGAVDGRGNRVIWRLAKERRGSWAKEVMYETVLPVVRVGWKNGYITNEDLASVLVGLACGEGERIVGPGVEGEGRTVRNTRLRTIAGLGKVGG